MKTKILYYLTLIYMMTVGLSAYFILKPPASVDAQCVELTLDSTADGTPLCQGETLVNSVQTNLNLGAVTTAVCIR